WNPPDRIDISPWIERPYAIAQPRGSLSHPGRGFSMTERISARTPQQAIAGLLSRYTPKRLLLVGASELPALTAFKAAHENCEIAHAPAGALPSDLATQRFDLALVADCLEHLPKRTGLELLGGIRNLNANRLAVLVDLHASHWQETDFFA